jgi:hypothetical protein
MGFIRGALLVIISTIFFIALLLSNLFLTVSLSLEHETLYPEVQGLAKQTLQEYDIIPEINSNFERIEIYCLDKEYFSYNSGEYSFKIPCEVIKQGQEATIDYGIGKFINETYYSNYDCEILDCIKESDKPFVLISEKTKDFFKQKFKLFLIISIALSILFFLLSEKKHSGLITLGILIGISAIPFKGVNWISSLFVDSIVFEFIGLFFTRAHNVFLIMIIIGTVFFLAGLSWGTMKYGFKVSRWFKKKEKEVEENTEKDLKKEKIEDEKKKENKLKREIRKLKEKLRKNKPSETENNTEENIDNETPSEINKKTEDETKTNNTKEKKNKKKSQQKNKNSKTKDKDKNK